MKICVVASFTPSLVTFRGNLLIAMVAAGHEVIAFGPTEDTEVSKWMHANNVGFRTYTLDRKGANPFGDLVTFLSLYKYFSKEKPDLVFSYTAKPVIWSSLAARSAGVTAIYSLVTGLGNQFSDTGFKQKLISFFVARLYKQALKKCDKVIFQNNDDSKALVSVGALNPNKVRIVNGSGVDLDKYPAIPLPNSAPVFLTIARFLVAKGIREYAVSARAVKRKYPDVQFRLVGYAEKGQSAIPLAEIQKLHDEGVIEYVGRVSDSVDVLAKCHVFVLASFYGEGLPRTILEAMAMGRPILTTDNVGCREAVEDGYNGKIVQPRSAEALTAGIEWFLENEEQWSEMARHSRLLAEEKYDVHKVNQEMFKIMGL